MCGGEGLGAAGLWGVRGLSAGRGGVVGEGGGGVAKAVERGGCRAGGLGDEQGGMAGV